MTRPCNTKCDCVIKYLQKKISIQDMGPVRKFLGISIKYATNKIRLHQTNYVKECCKKFQVPLRKFSMLMETGLNLDSVNSKDDCNLQLIIGSLMYLSICSQLDICFSVNYLSHFQNPPTKMKMKYACQILFIQSRPAKNAHFCEVKGIGCYYCVGCLICS